MCTCNINVVALYIVVTYCFLKCSGNSKQKWVPLNIEPPRPPPPRGSYYRYREGRDNWNGRRDFDKDRKDGGRGGGRFDRGGVRDRDRSHRPWRFDRDSGYKYREKDQYGRDRHDKGEGVTYNKHSGTGHWNQNGNEDMGWGFNGAGTAVENTS